MKKLFLILLLVSGESFAAECRLQRNSIGFENYEVCEIAEAGYTCVSLEDKNRGGIACFPTLAPSEKDTSNRKPRNLDPRY